MELNIGFLVSCSGRWPKELPYERQHLYGEWLTQLGEGYRVVPAEGLGASAEAVEAAVKKFRGEAVDIVVLVYGAFTGDDVAACLHERLGVPILLWAPYEPVLARDERLYANGLCAMMMNAAALRRLEADCICVYGSLEDVRAANKVRLTLKVCRAQKALGQARLGLFGYRPTAFYNCAFDEFLIRRVFGVRMEETELKVVFDLMDEMGSECEDCERLAERYHCVAMPDGHLDNHIRLHRALTQLMREQAYDFAVIKCWPEMGALHTTPCAVLGRMADEGLLIGCEGDVDAAITQYTEYLLSGEVPFITDLISMDEAEGVLNFWHCGNAAPSLHDTHFESLMSNHPLAGQGTAFYAPLKAGKVTIARFYNVGGQYKLALLSAEAISKERETKGCMVHVRTKRAPRDVIEQLLAEGVPHHYSIVWADIARELCMLSERLGIACVVL